MTWLDKLHLRKPESLPARYDRIFANALDSFTRYVDDLPRTEAYKQCLKSDAQAFLDKHFGEQRQHMSR